MLKGKSGPVVETTAGPVRGRFRRKHTIELFAGIPYAAPPVGDLRWRPPQPPTPWSEPLTCKKPGAMAYQRATSMDDIVHELVTGLGLSTSRQRTLATALRLMPRNENEDCLTLNVRAPSGASDLPVMVWIHGGDHTDGFSGDPIYHSSDALPARGCVLVTINYRLGLFGFLAHPDLSAESPAGVSGNYGLLDQIAALEWVRDNIAAFGGDPDRITIFGESAGGEAVLNLMTAPSAQGLIHRAIAQSPSDQGRWLHLRRPVLDFEPAETAGARFAGVAVGDQDGQLDRLRAAPADELMTLYRERNDLGRYFYPAVDGHVLPTTPMSAFSRQAQSPVPLLIGYNADEGTLIASFCHPAGAEFEFDDPTPDEVRATFVRSYGSEDAATRLLEIYPGLADGERGAKIDHLGDHMFGVHVDHACRRHAEAGHPVWRYHFRALPPLPGQTLGAFHAAELFHVFGSKVPLLPVADDAHLLTQAMGDRWFAFAATGSPDFPGREHWPRYHPDQPEQMVFDRPHSGVQPCPAEPGLDLMRDRIEYLTATTTGTAAGAADEGSPTR
ncbi:carboxylesterase/lipase family protein [Ilumatobacter sp.]|uniref:carboxylesterase/lipase family protein n=1 Tax=Ilumatobacter sp. TaxID=1967498 RepID=UPI003AF9E9F9